MRALPPEVGMLTESGHALSKYSRVFACKQSKSLPDYCTITEKKMFNFVLMKQAKLGIKISREKK